MHAAVSKKDLLRVLGRCQGVADKKSTMPVLGNVLLRATPDSLDLSATDLVVAVSGSVPAKVEKPGSIAVPAKDFFDRVRMMPEGQIGIEVGDGSNITIRSLTSARRYTLFGLPGDEFPRLPAPEGDGWVEIDVASMARLIATTYFSISSDETRMHLSSALFELEDNRARMVTTDGHRLSKMEVRAPELSGKATMLIPLKGVLELKRLCDEALSDSGKSSDPEGKNEPARIRILQSGPNVFFEVGGFHFSVKLVDAQFPPYGQVIPAQSSVAVRAPRLSFSEALKAVSLAASDRTGGVKLTLNKNQLRVESESPEAGEGFDEVPVDYVGSPITIGLNARYLLEVLGAIVDDEVIIGITGELDPAVIRPGGSRENQDYLAVVMPMRI
ncbi:MAG: DNA polymerase III subunit beta [Sorangiineae bacterium NIC37A_2]|jgi:DNA polymerase-3 subunit beta|nr:MAG: DNA polymerase III subunit beta [Sorangiineae bacterium NIC37A_2]